MADGEIKIENEKGIPRPPRNRNGIGWSAMEVGDSVFVADRSVNVAGRTRSGSRFSRRAVIENGIEGVRIWRVA